MLVPMDGSQDSANALAVALRLARASSGPVAALYVARPGGLTRRKRLGACALEEFGELDPEEADEAKLSLMPARVWGKTAGVAVELLAARGDAAHEITAAAAGRRVSRIVMGTHGQSGGSGGRLLGSVARAVFTSAGVPTVVVPPNAVVEAEALARDLARASEALPIGPRIVAAVDGGPGTAAVVSEALQMATSTRGSLRLFAGRPGWPGADAGPFLNDGEAQARAAGIPVTVERAEGDALGQLQGLTERKEADLIVVGTRAAPGHTHDHLGSFTDRLLAQVRCPVAVVRLAPR
jgi:nucleotide-binding universal stress UspA family protein